MASESQAQIHFFSRRILFRRSKWVDQRLSGVIMRHGVASLSRSVGQSHWVCRWSGQALPGLGQTSVVPCQGDAIAKISQVGQCHLRPPCLPLSPFPSSRPEPSHCHEPMWSYGLWTEFRRSKAFCRIQGATPSKTTEFLRFFWGSAAHWGWANPRYHTIKSKDQIFPLLFSIFCVAKRGQGIWHPTMTKPGIALTPQRQLLRSKRHQGWRQPSRAVAKRGTRHNITNLT